MRRRQKRDHRLKTTPTKQLEEQKHAESGKSRGGKQKHTKRASWQNRKQELQHMDIDELEDYVTEEEYL